MLRDLHAMLWGIPIKDLMIWHDMVCYEIFTKTSSYTEEFRTFRIKIIKKTIKLSLIWNDKLFFFIDKIIKKRVEIRLHIMIWYSRWTFNDILWVLYTMVLIFIVMIKNLILCHVKVDVVKDVLGLTVSRTKEQYIIPNGCNNTGNLLFVFYHLASF